MSSWNKQHEDEEAEAKAQVDIWKYIFGFSEQAVVKCAIELGIADVIESHGSPITLSQLSSTLGCDPSLLNRIMRFLINRNIFNAVPTGGYAQTPLSRRLMRNNMAAFILMENSPVMLAPWHNLSARLKGNDDNSSSSFEKAHGEDVWSYIAANPDHNNLFNEAMACDAKLVMPAIIQACKEAWDGATTVVDVGGGNGTAISILVKACPWIRGLNFDLPHVIAAAPECDGVEHVAGDMFQGVPKADVAFLKWVLHDWGDEECIQILSKCREAIPKENGRVIIAEAVIEEELGGKQKEGFNYKDVGLMLDMVMIAHNNTGKERTLREWDYVIQSAGFTTYTVKPIQAVQSVIIACP